MTEQGKNPGPDPSGPEPTEVERSLLADLLERSRLYHTRKDYLDLLAFVSRLRNFAPFNAMLLQIQRPGLAYVASEYDWRTRLFTKAAGQVETALGTEAHTLFERPV